MKHQVVVVHGGDTFDTYEQYLAFLRVYEIDKDYFTGKRWRSGLGAALGDEFEILSPSMPNKSNAKYLEWKIWFEKFVPFLSDGVIFVGHSLGGIFFAKYLSEEQLPKGIRGTFLVAAPYSSSDTGSLADFTIPASLTRLAQQGGKIYLYHSKDDPVVDFDDLGKYAFALPQATVRTFNDRGHFGQEEFPEIVADIKSLSGGSQKTHDALHRG